MSELAQVSIEWDEQGCVLRVETNEEVYGFVVNPLELHAAVEKEIVPWMREGEEVRREFEAAKREGRTPYDDDTHSVRVDLLATKEEAA